LVIAFTETIVHTIRSIHRNIRNRRGHGALCAIQHLGVMASQADPDGVSA